MDNEKKKTNPRENANIFSLLTFFYSLKIFRKGFGKDLGEEDLYEVIDSCRSKRCGNKTDNQWKKSLSIYKLLWRRFGKRYVALGLITITWAQINSIWQPYGISRLISYFDISQTNITKTDAYYSAAIVVFLNLTSIVFTRNFRIIEKILRLSNASLSQTNLGNILTILTKDIYIIESASWSVMDLLNYGAKTITVSYLLWSTLGNTAFIGLGLVFLALPLQIYLSNFLTKMRLEVGKRADERLHVMQETLSAIRTIKMYTWEDSFNKKISQARRNEVAIMMKASYITIIITAIGLVTSKLTFLVLILSYVWMGGTTTTELLFYTLTLFNEIGTSLGVMIPSNICRIAQFRASFIRLNSLLQAKELDTSRDKDNKTFKDVMKPCIKFENVVVKINEKEILRDVNLDIQSPDLRIVTGTVGSGKSSLLKAILDDSSIYKGRCKVNGTLSYASQEPWLFPSSIKENILFGGKYEPTRYEEVVRVCALRHDLSLMENGDETIVSDRGLNLSKGQQMRINLARAVYRDSDIYLLDDPLTALDAPVQDFILEEAIRKFLGNKICILVTQNILHFTKADQVMVVNGGGVVFSGKPEDFERNVVIQSTRQLSAFNKIEDIESEDNYNNDNNKVYKEAKKMGKVKFVTYKMYVKFGGGLVAASFIVFFYILAQICECAFDIYMTQWIDLQQEVLNLQENATTTKMVYENTVLRKNTTLSLYAVSVVMHMVFSLAKNYALLRFCRIASIKIHHAMASRIITAVMPFFDTNFIGNILNRFSHDLNNIDEIIPLVLPSLIEVTFACVGEIIVITTVNWVFLIPICVFLLTMVWLRVVYISTGRNVKRMEAAAKSPLVGHINSTLEGLTTIRAFKAQTTLTNQFDRYQDSYTSAQLTHLYTTTAFGFYMDVFSFIFAVSIISRFLFFDHDFSAGNVGLALTQVFILTFGIQWSINQWASLENDMTSVERALEYTSVKKEDSSGEKIENWPKEGTITYENVTLKYEKCVEPVLKGISFSIEAGQKIGIVGRTGAGKSSILSTLFRLYDYEGKICIDGVDITTVSLPYLRQNMAIIPQDPILFTGTIRTNIDPSNKHSDDVIWKAFGWVKVGKLIPSLETEVKEGGSHFSVGQKQLICLARAAIHKYKVVVLDEATANMDSTTDKIIHDIIENIFSKCTVLMIAHRLNSVLNCDKVVVLDGGRVVEFDSPRALLQDSKSFFYTMHHADANFCHE